MKETIFDQNPPKIDLQQFHHRNIFEQILYSVVTAPLSITKWLKATLLGLNTQNSTNEISGYEESRIYLDEWLTSIDEPLCKFSDEAPEWLDVEKFSRGRAFAMEHILGLVYAEELSVVLLMSLPMLRRPLIFSGKSDTTEKAFRRYLSTVERVITWYAQDIWDKDSKAYHNLLIVRGMHSRVEHNMQSCTAAQRDDKIEQFRTATLTPFLELLRADLEQYSPNTQQQKWLDKFQSDESALFINQFGMACTQIGFVGLLILHPEKFGASSASQEDLEAFVYVWYVLGHQLGIDDRFNICGGGLEETRRRCNHIIRQLVLPSLGVAGRDWEHMSRCVIQGVERIVRQTSFEASLAYSLWALGVPTPRVNTLVSWRELPRIWLFKSALCIFLNIPGISTFFGSMLNIRLRTLRRRLDAADRQKQL